MNSNEAGKNWKQDYEQNTNLQMQINNFQLQQKKNDWYSFQSIYQNHEITK